MSLSLIAAIGKNNELGKDNDLIWHFREDMKFFKETTLGSAVLMGRKTFESLPKALPGRRNLVVSHNPDFHADGAEVFPSVAAAVEAAGEENVFVIGGASIYKVLLDRCDRLYLTEIDATCDDAEVYFPSFDKGAYRRTVLAEYTVNGVHFAHVLYEKEAV